VSAVIQTSGLGKQYRRTWALRDCALAIPASTRSPAGSSSAP
jgi:hypothetical protein